MALRALRCLGLLYLAIAGPALADPLSSGAPSSSPLSATPSLRGETRPLSVAVAGALAPLARELVDLLQPQGVRVVLAPARGDRPLDALAAGQADLALVARSLTSEESARFAAQRFGVDRLLLAVHERNPLNALDRARVRAIFARETTDWQQIGAGGSGAIVPVVRAQGSDTRRTVDAFLDIGEVMPAGMIEVGSGLAAALYLAADPQAIGYLSAAVLERAQHQGLRLKILPSGTAAGEDGDCTHAQTIRPCRPLLLVRPRSGAARGAAVEAALTGGDGAALLARHGFLPATDAP